MEEIQGDSRNVMIYRPLKNYTSVLGRPIEIWFQFGGSGWQFSR
jgi:hypothetical protein